MTRIRASSTIAAALLFCAKVFGYPTQYGPFESGHTPKTIIRFPCELVAQGNVNTEPVAGTSRIYRPKSEVQLTVKLLSSDNGWIINVCDTAGKNLTPSPATNCMTCSQMEVFSCDLNHDDKQDFIVNVWSGGCGLAAEGSEVTFLLSGKDGYRATSFYLYDFGAEDLVQFKAGGPAYLILNDLVGNGEEKTSDGRDHNFWVYSLRRIDGTEFAKANTDQSGFPKWVWYSSKENHAETTLLTSEQKVTLIMQRSDGHSGH